MLQHQANEVPECCTGLPAERRRRLRWVPTELVDLGRAEVLLVDPDEALPVQSHEAERHVAELADRMRLTGRDHVVVRIFLLEHQPHRLDVLLGVPPVALRVEVAQEEVLLCAGQDRHDAARDLPRDERAPAPGRLVVEEDPVARVEPVCLAVVDGHEVGEHLRDGIR